MTAEIEVDLEAIQHNVRGLQQLCGVPVMPVVKAAGYGHGAFEVAVAALAAGASALGVADAHEAIALREAGIDAPILSWLNSPGQRWDAMLANELWIGVSSFDQLARVAETARERGVDRAPIHLKLDSGLGRNGAREIDWRALFAQARDLERAGHVRITGLFSHIAGAGRPEDLAQVSRFERAVRLSDELGLAPDLLHLAATGAAIRYPEARFDLVRVGIGIYGLSPFEPGEDPGVDLKPALRLNAAIHRTADGWHAPVGAVDGLPPIHRQLPPLIDARGDRWRLLEVRETSSVLEPMDADGTDTAASIAIIGPQTTTDDWALAAGTINYEITTRLSQRIHRTYTPAEPSEAIAQAPNGSAPTRLATVDLRLIRLRLQGWSAERAAAEAEGRDYDGPTHVDLSADAYGHGLEALLPLVMAAGLTPVARTERDFDRMWNLGATTALLDPDSGDRTRAVYGFEHPGELALTFVTELAHLKRVRPGQAVSYGYVWRATRETTLGLVPLGYADAIPRSAFGRARMRVAGISAPVVGRVAMDQVVVDLGDTETWPGAEVRVWGNEPNDSSLHEWSNWTGLPPQALLATLGSRTRREYAEERRDDIGGHAVRIDDSAPLPNREAPLGAAEAGA